MDSPEPDAADVERLILRAAGALVLFLLAAGVAFALSRDEEVAGPLAATGGRSAIELGAIGPLPGAAIDAYERSAKRALSAARGERTAVVSFTHYLTEHEARELVPGATALLVAAPSGSPRIVTDIGAWAAEERAAAEGERTELESLIPTVEDPAFATQYRRDIARLDRLLERIDPAGRIVFGAVVRADATALRSLARNRDVRLVDVERTPGAEITNFRGIRPEEREIANEPPTRP